MTLRATQLLSVKPLVQLLANGQAIAVVRRRFRATIILNFINSIQMKWFHHFMRCLYDMLMKVLFRVKTNRPVAFGRYNKVGPAADVGNRDDRTARLTLLQLLPLPCLWDQVVV